MPPYLSADWLDDAADRLSTLRLDPPIDPPGLRIGVIVGNGDDPVRFIVAFFGDRVELTRGDSEEPPDVRFTLNSDTAADIAAGTESAQLAFMSGGLRVGGDVSLLIDNMDSLVGLHEFFAPTAPPADA